MIPMTTMEPAPRPAVPERPRPTRRARRIAWIVAIVADAVQWAVLPLFAAGAVSPVNDVLDVVVGIVLIRLLGWHWAFLPAFVAELLPGVDLVPTWTFAVWLTGRGAGASKPSAGPA